MIVKIWYNLSQYSFVSVENCKRLTNVAKEDIKEKLIDQLEDVSLQNIMKVRGATLERAEKEFYDETKDCHISHTVGL